MLLYMQLFLNYKQANYQRKYHNSSDQKLRTIKFGPFIKNLIITKFEQNNMNQADYDYVFKILLIGNSGVGKSSLLMRFADDIFSESFLPTIGVDFKIRTIESSGSIVKLQMWDTAGQQKFKTIVSAYYKGAHGIILVYDITDKRSFEDVQNWLEESEKYSKENVVRILVGNKKDLDSQREVHYREAKQYADSLNMVYLQTSAKDKINIEQAFTSLVVEMKKKVPKISYTNTHRPPVILPRDQKKKNTTCC